MKDQFKGIPIATEKHEVVKNYYGKALQNSQDLKTDACCTDTQIPQYIKEALAEVHPEVSSRYYGCGLVVPEQLEKMLILDLGSGSGRASVGWVERQRNFVLERSTHQITTSLQQLSPSAGTRGFFFPQCAVSKQPSPYPAEKSIGH
jgi:hypothetical protein